MKKFIHIIIAIVIISGIIELPSVVYANDNAPSRVVNLVYDDSGSMIENNNGKKVDTWCQAKYAMEVLSAMLSENDTMNVYVMSDFESGTSGEPRIVLNGDNDIKSNVKKIHNMVTTAGNTPFNSVRKAESDLKSLKADEKWLVVLTDGEFEDGAIKQEKIDEFFSGKPDDIKILYLGMGADAGKITANENKNIYYYKAKNNNEILDKITDIGQRVFNRDRLDVESKTKTISFDIPMKELIVFAQGESVDIGEISDKTGKSFKSADLPVTVQYSKKAANNYSDIIIDKTLRGSIATFQGSYPAGKYDLDVSGAKTIEVYYKPDVEITASLKKGKKEVTDMSNLAAGDYTINFKLVESGTGKKAKKSKLLGDVNFEAKVTNNGKMHKKKYSDGDTIKIEEGPLSIDATARYLDYHTVDTHLDYSIYKDKEIGFSIKDNPEHEVTGKGFKKDIPMKLQATVDGNIPTAEQWDGMEVLDVKFAEEPDFEMGNFRVEKDEKCGIYNIYPSLGNEISGKEYKDADLNVSYMGKVGSETWAGNEKVTMKMKDSRSFLAKHRDMIFKSIVLLAILALLLGYVPGIKNYLPKKLKKRPIIKSKRVGNIGSKLPPSNGSFEKNITTTILPYVAEKGIIRYVPRGIAGAPKLQVKGLGSRGNSRMQITNMKDFTNKKYMTFDGERADMLCKTNPKTFNTSSALMITAEMRGIKYTCNLNE